MNEFFQGNFQNRNRLFLESLSATTYIFCALAMFWSRKFYEKKQDSESEYSPHPPAISIITTAEAPRDGSHRVGPASEIIKFRVVILNINVHQKDFFTYWCQDGNPGFLSIFIILILVNRSRQIAAAILFTNGRYYLQGFCEPSVIGSQKIRVRISPAREEYTDPYFFSGLWWDEFSLFQ